MRDLQDCRPYAEHLRVEHQRLNRCLCHVNTLFSDLVSANMVKALPRLIETLADLRVDLARHFAEEESGGCIEEAVCRCPSLSQDARNVEAQHPRLLGEVDKVIAEAQAARRDKTWIDDLQREFNQFAAQLRKHESAENRILQLGFGIAFDAENCAIDICD